MEEQECEDDKAEKKKTSWSTPYIRKKGMLL